MRDNLRRYRAIHDTLKQQQFQLTTYKSYATYVGSLYWAI